MKFCSKCSLEYDDDCMFCSKCGNKLNGESKSAFCPYCGKSVEAESEFCSYCGKSLKEDVVQKKDCLYDNSSSDYKIIEDSNGNMIKDNPILKWASIIGLYFVGLITWLVMYHFPRVYRSEQTLSSLGYKTSNNALPLGNILAIIVVGYILLFVIYFGLKKLNVKSAKFFSIIIYGVTGNVFSALGGIFLGIVAIAVLFVIQKSINKEKLGV